jgi:hypothetical protein
MKAFLPEYSAWFGKSVILVVNVRNCYIPMACCIVSETPTDLHVRIQPGWEMDVRKNLILAVDEVVAGTKSRIGLAQPAKAAVTAPAARRSLGRLDIRVAPTRAMPYAGGSNDDFHESKGDSQ